MASASHFFMNEAVGSENDGAAELIGIAGKVADFTSSFFDEKNSGGSVPLL